MRFYGLVLLWAVFGLMITEAAVAIGIIETDSGGTLLLSAVPVAITVWALIPRKTGRLPPAWHEWVADALIFFCALYFSASWDGMLKSFTPGPNDGYVVRLILLVILTPAFLLFYAPVRMLFLVEDGHRLSTWGRILLVALPFGRRVLFG